MTTNAKTDFLEDAILDHVLGTSSYTFPTQCYIGLFSDSATPAELEAGTLTNELSGNGYARQAIDFDAASGGVTQNAADVTFPQATGSWGTVSYFGIFDGTGGGENLIYYGAFDTPRAIALDDILIIQDGDLTIQEQ